MGSTLRLFGCFSSPQHLIFIHDYDIGEVTFLNHPSVMSSQRLIITVLHLNHA